MFQTFRRHQKTWLTALTLLAMLAFAFPITSTYFGGSGRQRRQAEVVDTIFQRKITTDDLHRARLERLVANTFVQIMISAVYPQYGHMVAQYEAFGTTHDDEAIKDGIRLAHKADEFGIRVSDDMIRNWIARSTDGKLTTEQFEQSVGRVGRVAPALTGERGISAEALFDILRNQLRIQQVQLLATGRFGEGPTPVTPYEAWQFYRKLNDKFGLEVIPVEVAEFTSQIEDPGDAALRELYDKFIGRLPTPTSTEPGFKEPRRVNLQYASVSLEAFKLAMKPTLEISDEEVQEYYDSHKEMYRIRPGDGPAPAPAEVPEKPASDLPEPKEEKKDEQGGDDNPNAKQPGSSEKDTKSRAPAPTGTDKPEDPCDTEQDDAVAKRAADTELPATTTAQESRDGPAKDDKKSAEPTSDEAKPIASPPQEESKQEREKPADARDEKAQEAPQFRPIEEVTSEIRDILTRDKARAELIKRLGQVDRAVNDFGRVYVTARDKYDEAKMKDPSVEFVAPQPPDFVGIAEELGLKCSETGLSTLDDEQFKSSGMVESVELEGGRARGRTVAEVMSSVDYYEPRQFQNFINDEFFSVWKIDDVAEQQPSFDKIRDKVLLAFQMLKARDLAVDRANRLAASLREVHGDISRLEETGAEIKTITIAPKTLWSNAPVFAMSMMSRPNRVPTELPGLRYVTDELRTKIFELKEGGVVVGPNLPQDVYYVVRVAQRQTASREEFARSRQLIESQLQMELAEKMRDDWEVSLRRESSGEKRGAPAGN